MSPHLATGGNSNFLSTTFKQLLVSLETNFGKDISNQTEGGMRGGWGVVCISIIYDPIKVSLKLLPGWFQIFHHFFHTPGPSLIQESRQHWLQVKKSFVLIKIKVGKNRWIFSYSGVYADKRLQPYRPSKGRNRGWRLFSWETFAASDPVSYAFCTIKGETHFFAGREGDKKRIDLA